jgi:hypothetical protein
VRTTVTIGLALLALTALPACGSTEASEAAGTSGPVEHCVQRLLKQADAPPSRVLRDYARRTYCEPFAKRGWVYPDGTVSIKAHEWLLEGGSCETVQSGTTTKCDARAAEEAPLLECAILHVVPRKEVRAYLEDLKRRRGKVECDDGTPLDRLGVA